MVNDTPLTPPRLCANQKNDLLSKEEAAAGRKGRGALIHIKSPFSFCLIRMQMIPLRVCISQICISSPGPAPLAPFIHFLSPF